EAAAPEIARMEHPHLRIRRVAWKRMHLEIQPIPIAGSHETTGDDDFADLALRNGSAIVSDDRHLVIGRRASSRGACRRVAYLSVYEPMEVDPALGAAKVRVQKDIVCKRPAAGLQIAPFNRLAGKMGNSHAVQALAGMNGLGDATHERWN